MTAAVAQIETRLYSELSPHPLNQKVYGKDDIRSEQAEQLRESIKTHGVLVPLLITRDNVIVSGHRRWAIAKMLHVDDLPVCVVDDTDALDIEALVIHANRQREKTTEQQAREFKQLKRIEAEKAKRRHAEAVARSNKERAGKADANPYPANLPDMGEARDGAAAAVGMKPRTAEKAATVIDAIDAAEAEGDGEKAETLRHKLNRSVDGAYREATGKPNKPPKPDERHFIVPVPEPPRRVVIEQPPIDEDETFLTGAEQEQLAAIKALWDEAGAEVRAEFRRYIAS